MSRDNDLEGEPDMGGKHGGQAGQKAPPPCPRAGETDPDVVAKRNTAPDDPALSQTRKK